jgi:hypothetical protein
VTAGEHRPSMGTVLASLPHRSLISAAGELEGLGLDELWLVEDCFLQYGGTSAAAAILAQLRRFAAEVLPLL